MQIEIRDTAQEQHFGAAGRLRERVAIAVDRIAEAAEFAQREAAPAHRLERTPGQRDRPIAIGKRFVMTTERAQHVAALHVAVGKTGRQLEQPIVDHTRVFVPGELPEQARALKQHALMNRVDRECFVETRERVVLPPGPVSTAA